MESVKLTADVVALAGQDDDLRVLLIRRGKPPFEGWWALPGGHLDEDERFCDAALRELKEETGFAPDVVPVLVGVYDDPDRDPRGRAVSVAFAFRVPRDVPGLVAGDDAASVEWVNLSDLTDDDGVIDAGFAFDHDEILWDALQVVGEPTGGTLAVTR